MRVSWAGTGARRGDGSIDVDEFVAVQEHQSRLGPGGAIGGGPPRDLESSSGEQVPVRHGGQELAEARNLERRGVGGEEGAERIRDPAPLVPRRVLEDAVGRRGGVAGG